ncbi:MAG: aminopeptidase P family protein [Deltaproteobacteria bacterium]|nr:aminopeptidase P family protein [Deltaproteobacteria bacterium]
MEDPRERLTTSISTRELERRWTAAREVMREEKVDFLLMRQDEEFLGGYVKWFTDIPAQHHYPFTVIFPADDEMSTISVGGPPPAEPFPPQWAVRGVKKRLSAGYFPSVHYTSAYDAELAIGVLKEKKGATIGWVGKSSISLAFYEHLRDQLVGYRFVDMTDRMDQIKAIKSLEELEMIQRTAALQDAVIEHVSQVIRPGLRDFEIHAEAFYSAMRLGSERQLILVGSGPSGTSIPFQHRRFQNRVVKEGDQISLLIEVNGPGGFYAEIARIFSIGKPSQQLQDAYGVALEAQRLTLNALKPEADPKDLLEINNQFLKKMGYLPEGRLYAHGQGYDLVERPLLRQDEPMRIKAGMNITVHPAATNQTVWATVCDNYLVTEEGVGPCLHQTPKEIIIV